jgi:hypothetical protein
MLINKELFVGKVVIVAYKPKPGRSEDLETLMLTHILTLRSEGLVTAREPIVMRAKDGTIIEVFEWLSKEAIESAHGNKTVLEMWEKYAEVCDFIPISQVDEAQYPFSEFTPIG